MSDQWYIAKHNDAFVTVCENNVTTVLFSDNYRKHIIKRKKHHKLLKDSYMLADFFSELNFMNEKLLQQNSSHFG